MKVIACRFLFFFFVSRAISLCMSLNRTGIFEDDNKWHRREDFGITHWAEHNALPTLFKAVVTDVQVSRERFWPMTEGLRFYNHQQQPGARTHTRTHREEGWAWTRPCLPQNVVKDFIKQHVKWTVLRDILQLKSKLWWIKPRSPDTVFFFLSSFLIGWLGESDWKEKERKRWRIAKGRSLGSNIGPYVGFDGDDHAGVPRSHDFSLNQRSRMEESEMSMSAHVQMKLVLYHLRFLSALHHTMFWSPNLGKFANLIKVGWPKHGIQWSSPDKVHASFRFKSSR